MIYSGQNSRTIFHNSSNYDYIVDLCTSFHILILNAEKYIRKFQIQNDWNRRIEACARVWFGWADGFENEWVHSCRKQKIVNLFTCMNHIQICNWWESIAGSCKKCACVNPSIKKEERHRIMIHTKIFFTEISIPCESQTNQTIPVFSCQKKKHSLSSNN